MDCPFHSTLYCVSINGSNSYNTFKHDSQSNVSVHNHSTLTSTDNPTIFLRYKKND